MGVQIPEAIRNVIQQVPVIYGMRLPMDVEKLLELILATPVPDSAAAPVSLLPQRRKFDD